jgi:Ca-activated chloride channel homolog
VNPTVHSLLWSAGSVGLALGALAFGAWLFRLSGRRAEVPVLVALCALPTFYFTATQSGLVPDSYVRFVRPWMVAPCTLVAGYALLRCVTLRQRTSRTRALLRDVTTVLLTSCLALAVTGLELGRPLDRLSVIVLVDRSRSTELVPGASSRIDKELRVAELGMRETDTIGVLSFGQSAVLDSPLRRRDQRPTPQTMSIGRDATDIERALRRALAELPADARGKLVLISDGVATRGDALLATHSAVAADVPIDVVPLDQAPMPNVRVVGLGAPSSVSEGETFTLRAVVEASEATRVRVRLSSDGNVLLEQDVEVDEGQDVLDLTQQAEGTGLRRYELQVSTLDPSRDGLADDNRRSAFLRVRGPSRALILTENASHAAPLREALESAEIRVETADVYHVPQDVAEFGSFDLVVLLDLPAHLLTPVQLSAIEAYVQKLGGGLLLFGSDQTMGPGGYGKTPVEAVSPVSFDLKQDRRRASLAEVIVIDYSGSMSADAGGHTKLELANDAAVRSAALLSAADQLGVTHVDSEVRWTRQLGPVTDEAAIAQAIRAVGPGGGGIFVDIGLRAAYGALTKTKSNLKHVLLFADGADAERMDGVPAMAKEALAAGITTSVVSLGSGQDVPRLEQLSRAGAGRFYLILDANRLPAVFAQETILAARSALNEVDFVPIPRGRSGPLLGIDLAAIPPLHGYVVTIPKPRAQVLLEGPEHDPILAHWSVGVGRAGAFTSDYSTRWGKHWTGWTGASQLFAQFGRSLARDEDDRKVRLRAEVEGGNLQVTADVMDDRGALDSYRELAVHVTGQGGFLQTLPLEALGPGRYGADLALERPGSYLVSAVDLATGKLVATNGAELSASDELRPTGTDRAALEAIARASRGRVRDTLAGIFDERLGRRFAYQDITPALLRAAGVLLVVLVAVRRWALPEWLLRLLARKRKPGQPATPRVKAPVARVLERKRARLLEGKVPAHPLVSPARPTGSELDVLSAQPLGEQPPRDVPKVPPLETAPSSHASGRKLTAAEVLLAKRRGRR